MPTDLVQTRYYISRRMNGLGFRIAAGPVEGQREETSSFWLWSWGLIDGRRRWRRCIWRHHGWIVPRLCLEGWRRKCPGNNRLERPEFCLPTANIARPHLLGLEREQRKETDLEPLLALSLEHAPVITPGTYPRLAVTSGWVDLGRTPDRETDTAIVTHPGF